MQICEILEPGLICTDLRAETKNDLFEEMVDLLVSQGKIPEEKRETAIDTLIERENQMTTGVAPGFALPHGKLEGVHGVLIALGISHAGVEYDALDGEPVHLVVMLFSEPQNPGPHIEVLSELGRLLSIDNLMEELLHAKNAEEVLQLLKNNE